MNKHTLQWAQGYGAGIFLAEGTQIASDVGTVTIPEAFMAEHYAERRQFLYSPDFTNYTPLNVFNLYNGLRYNVTVTLSDLATDFNRANEEAGFAQKPYGYTWHHLFDANGQPNTLQLVNTRIHQRSCPHVGGNRQYHYASNDLVSPPLRVAARNELWQEKNDTASHLLRKVGAMKKSSLREFYRRGEKILLSCQMLFAGESAVKLVKDGYLWEGSPLEEFPGLQPVGLDCGGNVLLADAEDKIYLLNHETNEIEKVDEALSFKDFLCTMTGLSLGS